MLDQDQIEANEAEGIRVADKATIEMIKRFKQLNDRKKTIEAEMETIKGLLKDEMSSEGLVHLTDAAGVELTTYSQVNQSRFDRKAAEKKLGANVLAEFVSTSTFEKLIVK